MKKGFTLIELLAVIVVLGIISVIVIPAIDRFIRNSANAAYDVQISSIIDAVKNWEADNPTSLPASNGDEVIIYLGQLKTGNYLRKDLTNPKTDEPFSDTTSITITNDNGRLKYVVDPDN